MKKFASALVLGLLGQLIIPGGAGLALGVGLGWLTGWVIELENGRDPAGTGRQIGWIYGLLIGGSAAAASSGKIEWLIVTLLYGMIGGLIGGAIPALIQAVNSLDGEEGSTTES